MSTKPIFSLFAPRHELGKARKGTIYLSKIAIGIAVAVLLYLVSNGSRDVVFWGSIAAFFTSKVCYVVNTGEYPSSWDVIPDLLCDGMLWMGWLFAVHLWFHEWRSAAFMFGVWLVSYPWSSE